MKSVRRTVEWISGSRRLPCYLQWSSQQVLLPTDCLASIENKFIILDLTLSLFGGSNDGPSQTMRDHPEKWLVRRAVEIIRNTIQTNEFKDTDTHLQTNTFLTDEYI